MGSTIADQFREHYRLNHRVCPVCGSEKINRTLVGYIVHVDEDKYGVPYISNADTYKDKNRAICDDCDWEGIVHDLISEEKYNEKTLEQFKKDLTDTPEHLFKSSAGETLKIRFADEGFEIEYNGELYFAKRGYLEPFNRSPRGNYLVDQHHIEIRDVENA